MLDASSNSVPFAVDTLHDLRERAVPLLSERFSDHSLHDSQPLHTA